MLELRAPVGKCPAFHSVLRALWSLRATSVQCHNWFWLYLATEAQPRGPEGQLSAGVLPWLTKEVVFCPICRMKRLPSSADVFHGRRSKQPSPSHLELTAESVGCLHTLQHGYSLRVQGWSAPDHQQRSASVPEGPVTHGAPA